MILISKSVTEWCIWMSGSMVCLSCWMMGREKRSRAKILDLTNQRKMKRSQNDAGVRQRQMLWQLQKKKESLQRNEEASTRERYDAFMKSLSVMDFVYVITWLRKDLEAIQQAINAGVMPVDGN